MLSFILDNNGFKNFNFILSTFQKGGAKHPLRIYVAKQPLIIMGPK